MVVQTLRNMTEAEYKTLELKIQVILDNTDKDDRKKIADRSGVNITVIDLLLSDKSRLVNFATAQHIVNEAVAYMREKADKLEQLTERDYAKTMADIRKKLPKGSVAIISDKLDMKWDSVYHAISRQDASPGRMDLIISEAEEIIKTASNQTALGFPEPLEFDEQLKKEVYFNIKSITYNGVMYSEITDSDKTKLSSLFKSFDYQRNSRQEISKICGKHPSDVSKIILHQLYSYESCLSVLKATFEYFNVKFDYAVFGENEKPKRKSYARRVSNLTEQKQVDLVVPTRIEDEKVSFVLPEPVKEKNVNTSMTHRKELKIDGGVLKHQLKYGDITLIHEKSGVDKTTISNFFNSDTLTRTVDAENIINTFKQILKERNESVKSTDSISVTPEKKSWFKRLISWLFNR